MSKLIEDLKDHVSDRTKREEAKKYYLNVTTKLEDIKCPTFRTALECYYKHGDVEKAQASLWNAFYTKKTRFGFTSFDSINNLIESDPNIREKFKLTKGAKGTYNALTVKIDKESCFTKIRIGSKSKGVKSPALLELIYPELQKSIPGNREDQEKEIYALYGRAFRDSGSTIEQEQLTQDNNNGRDKESREQGHNDSRLQGGENPSTTLALPSVFQTVVDHTVIKIEPLKKSSFRKPGRALPTMQKMEDNSHDVYFNAHDLMKSKTEEKLSQYPIGYENEADNTIPTPNCVAPLPLVGALLTDISALTLSLEDRKRYNQHSDKYHKFKSLTFDDIEELKAIKGRGTTKLRMTQNNLNEILGIYCPTKPTTHYLLSMLFNYELPTNPHSRKIMATMIQGVGFNRDELMMLAGDLCMPELLQEHGLVLSAYNGKKLSGVSV